MLVGHLKIGSVITDAEHSCWKRFADARCFAGTCYRAANWVLFGDTRARGRMDRYHEAHGAAHKLMFVYPLAAGVHQRLCHDSTRSTKTFVFIPGEGYSSERLARLSLDMEAGSSPIDLKARAHSQNPSVEIRKRKWDA